MGQLSRPRGPRQKVCRLGKKDKEQVARICGLKATSTEGICMALGMDRSERQIAQLKKDLQGMPEIEYAPAWGGWRAKVRQRWRPGVAQLWTGRKTAEPLAAEPSTAVEAEPETAVEAEPETAKAKKLTGEVRKRLAIAIRELIRSEGPRIPAQRIREAFGEAGLKVAAGHRSFREQLGEDGQTYYLNERRVQRRPPEEGELQKLLDALPAAVAQRWAEREGNLPRLLGRYAQMHGLADPAAGDDEWNRVIDHLDKNHPGWRGFKIEYLSGEPG